ncbi:MAG: restriction endonuclease subunit S [Cyclobacteriaceae bacterium]|nr:restriction endonuclease subunit S [Cyclobacteriaceae bacterium]
MKFEKLGNIVEVKKGKKQSFAESPGENSVRVLQIDDLRNDTNPKFTNDKTGVFAKEDDILIAWDGANAGTIGYGKSGYIGSTIALLRKKQPDLFSTTFIGIFLKSQYQYLRSKTTGATIPHISRKVLDELEIPVISVNDQLHIANLLSKAENLIAQRKESIRLLDEFLKSTFSDMFDNPVDNRRGFEIVRFKELMTFITSGGRGWGEYYSASGERFIRSLDVQMNYISNDDVSFVIPPNNQEAKRTKVRDLDILLTITGSKIGRVAMVPINFGTAYVSQHVAIIRTQNVNPLYLSYYLSDINCGQYLIQKSFYGQTKPGLNFKQIEGFEIVLPPLDLQTQFAQIVSTTEALKTQYQQSLQELENMYGSLSQKAFKGELSVNQLEKM